jgi:polyisoprenoid-binding protein YceI
VTSVQTETSIPTGVWKSDPVHSHVGFEVRHTAATFRGSFGEFEAELRNEDDAPRLTGKVKVESVDVRDEALSAHLLSPEFFDAERNPEIGFESSSVRVEDGELVVEGELTVSGNSKPVAARGKITGPTAGPDAQRIGIALETKVDRHDYGLDWNMELPDGGTVLGDEVTISVELELAQESA